MARANTAYYATRDPFADFTTAPEIGQVFGELLGAWLAVTWRLIGAPDPVLLVEAGPGRGTLMEDARRAIARVAPDLAAAARVHLVETSPRLRQEQAARVAGAVWHDALDSVPSGPVLLLANEFLDALPIRQFLRTETGWAERFVAGGGFVLRPAEPPTPDAAPGRVVEIGEAGLAWISALGARLVRQGGAALIIDYGTASGAPGDSLQALRHGRPADPLADPGTADLTAHVDFMAVATAARSTGAAVWGPVPQGALLTQLGLRQRTSALAQARPDCASVLREAADRLAAPARMGALFKAICIAQPGCPQPPGFGP